MSVKRIGIVGVTRIGDGVASAIAITIHAHGPALCPGVASQATCAGRIDGANQYMAIALDGFHSRQIQRTKQLAGGAADALLRDDVGKRRRCHCRQDSGNGNSYEQLDQGKTPLSGSHVQVLIVVCQILVGRWEEQQWLDDKR